MPEILTIITHGILGYFIISVIIYTMILFAAFPYIIYYFRRGKYARVHELLESSTLPPVTIIIPTYNEKENILNAVESVLNSNYQNLYVFVMNDSSTDNTLDILDKHYSLKEIPVIINPKLKTSKVNRVFVAEKQERLMVFDKEHAGAGDSINVGINACFTPYFMTFDADSIMDKFAVDELVYEILTSPNTIAVGGGVYILNACEVKNGKIIQSIMPYNLVAAIQSCEYMRSHIFNRTGWNSFGGTVSYSGTSTLFNRSVVIEAGGFDTTNFAQDAEIIMRLHRHMHKKKEAYQVKFNPASVVWTDIPSNFVEFAYQRDHWRRGLLRSCFKNMKLFLNPKCKIQGLWCFPAFVFLDMLAPPIEFLAYLTIGFSYYYGILNINLTILLIILAWGFTTYITMANHFLNIITFNRYHRLQDIGWIFVLCILEMCGFRQYTVLIQIWGSIHYYFNRLLGKPI